MSNPNPARLPSFIAPQQAPITNDIRYDTTLANMLTRLSTLVRLNKLNTDISADWSVALLHSWAMVIDILAFYQERILKEGYWHSATERRSVVELARAIGYELRPALAATTYLSLFVQPDLEGQPQKVEVNLDSLQKEPAAVQKTP